MEQAEDTPTDNIAIIESIRNYVQKGRVPPKPNLTNPERKQYGSSLIVVSSVHCMAKDGSMKSSICRYSRNLNSKEDAYSRKFELGTEWRKLDIAWLEDTGYVVLHNIGGIIEKGVPSNEQIEFYQSRVIELGIKLNIPEEKHSTQWSKSKTTLPTFVALFQILVGESMQFNPINYSDLYIRCRNDKTQLNILALPK